MTSAIFVSVDLDDTLITDNRLERTVALAQLDALATQHDRNYDRAAAEAAIDGFLTSVRESDGAYDLFMTRFFQRFSGGRNSALDVASAYRAAVLDEAANHVRALPGARETLAGLDHLMIPYAMLTNGWTALQEHKARLIGFRGPAFVSERIGARKPEPKAFATVRDYFGVPYSRIWHVGDNALADCAGAKGVGMTTVWFDRHGGCYPSNVAAPDHVVHSHSELLALLSAASTSGSPPSAQMHPFDP